MTVSGAGIQPLAVALFSAGAALGANATIRADGTLVVDGEAALPIGIRLKGNGEPHREIAKAPQVSAPRP